MKFYKSICVKKEKAANVAEMYGCFGWTVAGKEIAADLRDADEVVKLKLVRDSNIERYDELLFVETKYRRAEAEIRYWNDLCAAAVNETPNKITAAVLCCCFIVPGIAYLLIYRFRKRKRREIAARAETRMKELRAEKSALIEEARTLTQSNV